MIGTWLPEFTGHFGSGSESVHNPHGNYVTVEQMYGVLGCDESERRLSAPWYANIDLALMGIQSTAQFVEKYHHIIGE